MGLAELPGWLWLASLFLFGVVFGSFGNVVIWRLPRKESLSSPPSHCPVCNRPISWYDNVPVVSWLLLAGKCRACRTPISPRYPAVEMLSGVLWVIAGWRFGQSITALAAAFFFYLLLLLAFIDWDTMRLPNTLVGILFGIGLAGVAVSQFSGSRILPLVGSGGRSLLGQPLPAALLGALVSAGAVLLIGLVYQAVRGASGFGMGDVKLLVAIGMFLGLYTLMALFIGTLAGAVYGIVSARRVGEGGQHKFPFGPFLALGAIVVAVVGPPIWVWYATIAGLSV